MCGILPTRGATRTDLFLSFMTMKDWLAQLANIALLYYLFIYDDCGIIEEAKEASKFWQRVNGKH